MKNKKIQCPYCSSDIYAKLKIGRNDVTCGSKLSYVGCGKDFIVEYINNNIKIKKGDKQ